MAESRGPNGGWRKYFKVANQNGELSPLSGRGADGLPGYGRNDGRMGLDPMQGHANIVYRNYASRLPEVYSGHPNRIERYNQYEAMDMDSEINACLDILAEFSTQLDKDQQVPFAVNYSETPTDNEVRIIKEQLRQWVKLNKLDQRIFRIFRNTIKYGDQVFVRDPETFEMYWVDMTKVARVIVNESEGKRPEQYVIRDINPNFQNLTVAAKTTTDYQSNPPSSGYTAPMNYTVPNATSGSGTSRFSAAMNEAVLDAKHIVHLSLTEGLDFYWPFGQSVLETIFRVFKQKELLEDAVLIYRVARAPERRVFKIDVGNMPSHMAMAFVERVKNEIHQRRIPSNTGGGQHIMDSSYNPLSINEDYFFPQTSDGRGSSVDTLAGGSNLGEIDDLKYFNNKMCRGLRVPSSYLPTGPDDSDRPMNDGRVGTALIQEYRFNQYCERLQRLVIQKLDDEFKMFMRWRGFNIDAGLFNITFNPPQNFASYREAELDTTRVGTYMQLEQVSYLSKRFLLKRYLGLTENEIRENEELWEEERAEPAGPESTGQDLRSVGVTPADLESDIATGEEFAGSMDLGAPGSTPSAPGSVAPGQQPAAGAGAPVLGAGPGSPA